MTRIKLHSVGVGGKEVYSLERDPDYYIYYKVMVSTFKFSDKNFAETYAWAIHKNEIKLEKEYCKIHPIRPGDYKSRQKVLVEKDMSKILKVNHGLDYYPKANKDFKILMFEEISKEEAIKINK